MKIIRYQDTTAAVHYGRLRDDGTVQRIEGDVLDTYTVTDEPADVGKLLAPVMPPLCLAIGGNYRRHIEESGGRLPEYPVVFVKGPNAVQNPGDPIYLPRHLRSDEVDYECELAVVIGTRCKNVPRADAFRVVLGYTCINDISSRDWQVRRSGGQFCKAKSFDTFAPMGPCIVTPDDIPDPNRLRIRTLLNDEVMQDANTSDMLFDVPVLVEFLSGSTTLLPGTVIATGTPQGVGMARKPPRWLQAGDTVTVDIEGIGALTNPVLDEPV